MQTTTAETTTEQTGPRITVTARLFALYREAAGQDRVQVAVPPGTTVRGLWPYLVAAAPRLQRVSEATASTAYAVNDTWAKGDQALRDGDEVAFLPPVGGG